ncbi:MAG: helix-turn-helix transcriptional regulator [Collinsella intestinalis]
MSELKETIARALRVKRAEANMSQEELAKRSGVSVDAIRSYERQMSLPLLETAYKLAEALGCTVNDLCGIPKEV